MHAEPRMRIRLVEFDRWRMERFVAECNISRFEQMLRETDDPAEQRLLEELLADERAKLTRAVASGVAEPVSVF